MASVVSSIPIEGNFILYKRITAHRWQIYVKNLDDELLGFVWIKIKFFLVILPYYMCKKISQQFFILQLKTFLSGEKVHLSWVLKC